MGYEVFGLLDKHTDMETEVTLALQKRILSFSQKMMFAVEAAGKLDWYVALPRCQNSNLSL